MIIKVRNIPTFCNNARQTYALFSIVHFWRTGFLEQFTRFHKGCLCENRGVKLFGV